MNSGVASELVRIHDLPNLPFATKVRFLGYILQHDIKIGVLHLNEAQHARVHLEQQDEGATEMDTVVKLDLSAIDDLRAQDLSIGSWINVVGYVDGPKHKPVITKTSTGIRTTRGVRIKAQMLWSTGPLDIKQYFKALESRKKMFMKSKDET